MYILFYFIFMILAFWESLIDKRSLRLQAQILNFFCILLIIAGTLRINSPDQATYEMMFSLVSEKLESYDHLLTIFPNSYLSQGFFLVFWMLKKINLPIEIFYFMQLTFNIFVFRWLSKKISPFPALSFLIFFSLFFYHSVGALRYSIIISLFLISFFIFIKSSGFLKKLTVVATATQAHLIWPVLMTFFIPRNNF